MKNPWVIILIIAIVLIGGSVLYANSVSEKNNEGIEFKPHVKGGEGAVIELVEYSDLECPACAAFQPYLEEILAQHGEQIKFEYRNFPLPIHQQSIPAAMAAEAAAQQDAFFPFVALMFKNQTTWAKALNPEAKFIEYATELGLDIDKFKRQMRAPMIKDKVKADQKSAVDRGITGTPTFFLNDQRMNFSSYDEFKNQIETALNPSVEFKLPE